jgi:hypothetical protein
MRRGFLYDKFARFLEGEHQGVLSQRGYCNAAAECAPVL